MIYSFQVLQLICGTHFELPRACYMPRPYPHWFNHGNNILWRVQIMKLVVNNFLQLPLRSKPRPLYLALYVCMFVCCVCRWGLTMSLNCGHWQAYCSSHRWYVCLESRGGMILTEESRRTRRKTCPIAILSTTNSTRIEPGTNPGLRDEKPVTNRLSHIMAVLWM
jgi:hypothetical protein